MIIRRRIPQHSAHMAAQLIGIKTSRPSPGMLEISRARNAYSTPQFDDIDSAMANFASIGSFLPTCATPYVEQLRIAMARTRALGIPLPALLSDVPSLSSEILLTAALRLEKDARKLAREFRTSSNCDVARKCAMFSLAMMPEFERAIQRKVLITVGSVAYEGVPILQASSDNLREIQRLASYHVWWSLGGAQIVDISLMAHLAALKEARPPTVLPIVGSPDNIKKIVWRPHLVGSAVVKALTC